MMMIMLMMMKMMMMMRMMMMMMMMMKMIVQKYSSNLHFNKDASSFFRDHSEFISSVSKKRNCGLSYGNNKKL